MEFIETSIEKDELKIWDGLLTDMQMPGMDGKELTHKIRTNSKSHDLKIGMMSSMGEKPKNFVGTPQGVDFYINKPVRGKEILGILERVLTKNSNKVNEKHLNNSLPNLAEKSIGRVLMVDDNAINRKVAVGMLKKLNVESLTAVDGENAIEILEKESFDLVLLDVHMPKKDGYETTKEIRKNFGTEYQYIPIVALTANAMQGDREKCLSVGMNDYLSKPFSLNELKGVLEKWL